MTAKLCDALLKQDYWPYGKSGLRCLRKEWKDGKCKIHHPDEKKRRQKQRDERREYEYKRRERFFRQNDIASPDNFT